MKRWLQRVARWVLRDEVQHPDPPVEHGVLGGRISMDFQEGDEDGVIDFMLQRRLGQGQVSIARCLFDWLERGHTLSELKSWLSIGLNNRGQANRDDRDVLVEIQRLMDRVAAARKSASRESTRKWLQSGASAYGRLSPEEVEARMREIA